jgi:hypothetical protein
MHKKLQLRSDDGSLLPRRFSRNALAPAAGRLMLMQTDGKGIQLLPA